MSAIKSKIISVLLKNWFYRYFKLSYKFGQNKKSIERQLSYLPGSGPQVLSSGPRILVPMIETSHYQFYQVLALSKALQLRGAKIKLLLCGSMLQGCELKSTRSFSLDPCLNCRFNAKKTVPMFGLDVITLSDIISEQERADIRSTAQQLVKNYPDSFLYEGIEIMLMVNDSVIRYYYGAVPPEGSEELERIKVYHLETAMLNIKAAHNIYQEWQPQIVMGNMNVYSTWEPYFRIAPLYGIDHSVVSMSTFDYNSIVLNRIDIYKNSNRFDKWLASRNFKTLDDAERSELNAFVENRFSGASRIFVDNNVFEDGSDVMSILKIDKTKKNIFLFTNIYWDVGLSETGSLYNGVIPWVLDTIELLKENKDCHLYIKTHPAEVFDSTPSLKGVIQFIQERFPILPANVTIIRPEYKIKTYYLFPFIDLGVVYNGTLGLEMLLRNIPVVITGMAPYGYLDSVFCPETIEEYKKDLNNKNVNHQLDTNEIELFAYFYFVKALLPWNLTEQAFGNEFSGFSFQSLDDLLPGKNKYLDHLCNCIMDGKNNIIENWA